MAENKPVNQTEYEDARFRRGPELVNRIKSLGEKAIDIVLPPQTLFRPQRGNIQSGAAQSWADVRFLDEPCCMSCGFPFEFDTPGLKDGLASICGRCAAKSPSYDHVRAAFTYDDASRSLVLRFKHGGETEGVPMFARQMQRAGRRLLSEADVLMPVPLHRRRLLKRRFNQSALLARAISKQMQLPLDTNSLFRKRHTPSQGGQTFDGRKRNVSGAFGIRPQAKLRGKHIVLIDDVMTTGATLESCARTLKRAGAKRVDAIVLARVVKPATVPT